MNKENETKVIPIDEIIVTDAFRNSKPSDEKMKKHRTYWNQHHTQQKFITLNERNILTDGYIQYLILKENNIKWAGVEIVKKKNPFTITYNDYEHENTVYVFGKHINSRSKNEYVWRIPKKKTRLAKKVQVGDIVMCNTKYGKAPVQITNIKVLSSPPIEMEIKTVACICDAKLNEIKE